MRGLVAGMHGIQTAEDMVHLLILYDDRERHNKACPTAVGIHDLMVGIGRNHHKVRFSYSLVVALPEIHSDVTVKGVLDFIEGVLGIFCEQAFVLTTDDARPENAAIHEGVGNLDVVFVDVIRLELLFLVDVVYDDPSNLR